MFVKMALNQMREKAFLWWTLQLLNICCMDVMMTLNLYYRRYWQFFVLVFVRVFISKFCVYTFDALFRVSQSGAGYLSEKIINFGDLMTDKVTMNSILFIIRYFKLQQKYFKALTFLIWSNWYWWQNWHYLIIYKNDIQLLPLFGARRSVFFFR